MSDWERFNDQFRETEWERSERWRQTRAKRRAEGKCWQCGTPIAECRCPNLDHSAALSCTSNGAE